MNISLHQSSKESILQYLLKNNKATAQEIAKAIDISPQAIRRHLKDLESQNLIDYEIMPLKSGRPQHSYYLSQQGRDLFPQNYGDFAVSFLDTMAETVGEKKVTEILAKQWQKKASMYRQYMKGKNIEQRVQQLAEIRRREGYMAELYSLSDTESEKFFFSEHNCAISDVAQSYPQVCGHELEMFASLFPDCKVERTNWIYDGEHRCGYLITNG
ncbi:transcriptional regulator of FeS assembly SufR [Cyanobacterium sp. HL-69]|uniref:iron-sulfur cluster biosynthesis transcriptional regulator SufR n=1 Tax=Cyanobacterium sp. HL-69 TaxID=2054282 RepID=UPI000CA11DBB|nr:transcriptional regulator of FeS assembly SufR [Cyanobacterium sp. HL-69]